LKWLDGLLMFFGLGGTVSATCRVRRSETETTARTDIELRWLGRVWRHYTAGIEVGECEVRRLSLSRGERCLFMGIPAAPTHSVGRRQRGTIGRRLQLVLAYLTIPAIAAVAALSLLLSSSPSVARAIPNPLAESYRLEASGDLKHAVQAASIAARKAPQEYFPMLRLAHLEFLAKSYTAAAIHYAEAADLAPDAIEPLLGQLQALVASEHFDQALVVADAALRLDSKNYVALSRRAWARYQRGQYPKAAFEYSELVTLYPGDIEMRIGRAYALSGAKKFVEAGIEFREVLKRVPGEPRARTALGLP
jgi:tetratricopeptide (TPR) repeat protein